MEVTGPNPAVLALCPEITYTYSIVICAVLHLAPGVNLQYLFHLMPRTYVQL